MRKIFFTVSLMVFAFFKGSSFAQAYTPQGNYIELSGGFVQAVIPQTIPAGKLTVETWIRPQSLSGQQKILSIGNANEQPFYELGINGGSVSFDYRTESNGFVYITAGNMQNGLWNHIAVTLNSSQTAIYLNGNRIYNGSGVTNPKALSGKVFFGKSVYQFNSTVFKGSADTLKVSLDTFDVAKKWLDGVYEKKAIAEEKTLLLWNFDGIRGGTSEKDESAYKIDGNLTGGDILIHYYGVLPTATPVTNRFQDRVRWVLPTLSFPGRIISPVPTEQVQIPTVAPSPTAGAGYFDRYERHNYYR